MSVFLWTYGILPIPAGFVGDRFSRRKVVLGSVGLWSLVTIVSSLVTSSWQLVAMRVPLAIAQVCYMPTAQAFITDFHGTETRSKAIGLYQEGSYIGIFLAGLPAAYIPNRLNWRAMFIQGEPR